MMKDGRFIRSVSLILGIILVIAGLIGIGLYFAGVVDIILEQPADRSWLFWGLGVALTGATLLVSGGGLLYAWRVLQRGDEGAIDSGADPNP